jgi:hypothetical protein
MQNYEKRIQRLEKLYEEVINPKSDEMIFMCVDETEGDTYEKILSDKEAELGRKIDTNSDNVIVVRLRLFSDESIKELKDQQIK